MKKILAVLCVLCLVCAAFPGAVLASGDAASGEAAAVDEPAYGDLEEEPGSNAVVSWHEDLVVYISEGEEITVSVEEDQTPYLTVGGVNVPMAVGNYDDTVAVDVVDPIFESEDYQESARDVDLSTELAGVIYITEDGLQEDQSVLSAAVGGEITDTSVSGVTITSEDVAGLSGIRAGGSAMVEVDDVTISLSGEGGNDFMGQGAALCATDGSTLVARDVTVEVSGYVRSCTFVGGSSTLLVYDSTFICDAGEFNADASVAGAGHSQPPAGLGVYGNARLNTLIQGGTAYYENCTFINRNWGCLGVDDVTDGLLTCVDCSITVTECGYGAYSIGDCLDIFIDCSFDINDGMVAIVSGAGNIILEDTEADSNRYGIVAHQGEGAVSDITILGGELNTAYCAVMVKDRSANIEVGGGAVLTASETGILIQAQDNDDTGAGAENADKTVNVQISDTTLEGDIVMSMAPADGYISAMNVDLSNTTITGAVSLANADPFISDGNISLENMMDVGMVENEYAPREDACYLSVSLADGAVWNVTETSYVTELTVEDGCELNGVVTEADGYYIIEPAT